MKELILQPAAGVVNVVLEFMAGLVPFLPPSRSAGD